MFTITKKYTGLPAAHRQHTHGGHCAMIHGHNWDFEIALSTEQLDENGFVFDFGKMKDVKQFLEAHFDHTLLLNHDDPERESLQKFLEVRDSRLANIIVLQQGVSCEGIAIFVYKFVSQWVKNQSNGRVTCTRVTVFEDEHNSARYPE